jgi:hypothetical protein
MAVNEIRLCQQNRQRGLYGIAAPVGHSRGQQNIRGEFRAQNLAMRNMFMDRLRYGAHPDLVSSITHANGLNTALSRLLNEVIDSGPTLAVILPEHVVIGATRGHAGTLDRYDHFRVQLVQHPFCPRLGRRHPPEGSRA